MISPRHPVTHYYIGIEDSDGSVLELPTAYSTETEAAENAANWISEHGEPGQLWFLIRQEGSSVEEYHGTN